MRNGVLWASAALGMMAAPAGAECKLSQLMELPVTMEGHLALVPATINGQSTLFQIDSGAFYSILSEGAAAQFGLKKRAMPDGFAVSGIGGDTTPSVVTVKAFDLGAFHSQNVQFLVMGNEFGYAGLIGQNFLAKLDVEYDLARGVIRLFKDTGCAKSSLAYWSECNFSEQKVRPVADAGYQTVGTISLNGAAVEATFDTGAYTSILSTQAAARAGVRPNSPGVEDAGFTTGIGRRRVRTWIGRFASIKIGDNEEIKNVRIRFGDIGSGGEATMLLSADFFLSHRIMVDNTGHRLFLTHNGGPVFNLSHDPDKDEAKPATIALVGPEPTDAGGFARRGAGYLARRDVPRAIADLRQAVKLAPGESTYHRQLAGALLADDKRPAAMAELDAALAAKRDDLDALLMRGELRAGMGKDGTQTDPAGARADADSFAAAAPRQANNRRELANLYQRLHAPEPAVRALTDWIDAHPHDIELSSALNGRCWVRALAAIELDQALDDCNRAVRLSHKASSVLDSRALVWFRRGDLAQARADYDAAIAADPRAADSLYMRSIVETRAGDRKAAEQDLSAATALDKEAGEEVRRWGIKP